jgi:uncharacterized membrane protein YqjE
MLYSPKPAALNDRDLSQWIFGALIPLVYLVIELGFHYQLINITAETVNDETLSGLEFWGRVISGVGLGLAIYRLSFAKFANKILPLALCLIGGIIVMWNVQRELTQYLIDSANAEDKIASVALSVLATQAAEGGLKTLKDQPLVSPEITPFEKKLVKALFPAAALHSDDRAEQINAWLDQVPVNPAAIYPTYFTPENSFKNLIVPPIAIGLSILFAILNLSLLISFFVEIIYKKYRLVSRALILSLLLLISTLTTQGSIFSDGYESAMRSGLWKSDPTLALLVEWSGLASPAWGSLSRFASQTLLGGYLFGKPSWIAI